jgi:hypothetical protein
MVPGFQAVVVWQVEQVLAAGKPFPVWSGTDPPNVAVLCHWATWQL